MSAPRRVRVVPLLLLTLVALVLAASSVAVFRHGPGEMSKGYLASTSGDGSCIGHLATSPGGPATVQVTLTKTKSGTGCGTHASGHRVYYDPNTLDEVPGPVNYLIGGGLLGLFALACLAGAGYVALTGLRGPRRRG